MKRIRFIGVIAVILVAAMALSSCSFGATLTKVLNKDYDLSDNVYTANSTISDLQDFEMVTSSQYFALFTNTNSEGRLIQKVFSLAENKVVNTYTNSSEVAYGINLHATVPAYTVSNPEKAEKAGDPDKMVYRLYDIKGAEIANTEENASPSLLATDLFYFDEAIYAIDENDLITKAADVPEYLSVAKFTKANDKYFYTNNNGNLAVYDRDFNLCSVWSSPLYADLLGAYVLNNGNYIVQYAYELADDAEDYDILDDSVKYDLVTVIIDVKTGEEKEVKADFVISTLRSNYEYYSDKLDKNENRYTDNFENIAYITYIENKNIDTSVSFNRAGRNSDVVLIGNNGKVKGSLKSFDTQVASLPSKIADDRYIVDLKTGDEGIINASGKLLNTISANTLTLKAGYFVGEKAIYNADLEVVYDLKENDATVKGSVGNTLFINKKASDDAYDIISIRDGIETTVLSVTKDSKKTFSIVDGVGYCIADGDGNYKYYNVSGTEIASLKYSLSVVLSSSDYDTVILKGTDKGVVVYHQFDIA